MLTARLLLSPCLIIFDQIMISDEISESFCGFKYITFVRVNLSWYTGFYMTCVKGLLVSTF